MDVITKSFVNEFVKKFEFEESEFSEQFELFANYCVVFKEYNRANFNVEETLTGKATSGIDGIAIMVNNKLVTTTEEIQNLIEHNGVLTANFIFIQAKTSSSFDNKQMLNFSTFVEHFFSEDNSLFHTEEMQKFIELKNFIIDNSIYMTERNPKCDLYFVTTGKWQEDPPLRHVLNKGEEKLNETNLFSEVSFHPYDAKAIQNLYRKTKELESATVTFEKKVTLPKIPEVSVAYSGILPFSEYRKIIIEDDKIKDVFDDNIRDFLGTDNDVNAAIQSTLNSGNFDAFSILNNGVTVVADKITGLGETITISGYQVVNGCQTSHVLYENRNKPGIDKINIPVKVIITTNEDIKNQITKATNNQTAVKKEELEALSEFQRGLENYYNSFTDEASRLYYERRTNQYNNTTIPKTRIVPIHTQIKAFTSMFLDNPHAVNGYYGTIAKKMEKKIFIADHENISYYTAALTYYKLDVFFRTGKLNREGKRMKHHILMLFRLKVAGPVMPEFNNSKKMIAYCKPIIEILNDSERALRVFEDVISLIKEKINLDDRKAFERKETTDLLLKNL